MKSIKVFFGYQFNNSEINRIDRESAYTEVLDNANQELNNSLGIILSWEYWALKTNSYLGEQILSKLDNSDILVFDLSEKNINVFLELGYSIALSRKKNKKVIIVVHDDIDLKTIGSDLSGQYILKINKSNIIQKLSKHIRDAAIEFVASNPTLYIADFWGATSRERFHLICPEIPVAFRTHFSKSEDSNYLRYSKFADIDTLIYIKTNLKSINKNSTLIDFTSEEYNHSLEETQIVIGGPAWNRVAKEYHKILPVKFEDGGAGFDDPIIIYDNDKVVERFMPVTENDSLLYDISIFAKLTFGNNRSVFLISGCRTLGVLGAATVFFSQDYASKNIEWITSHTEGKDFILVFNTQPFYGTVSSIVLSNEIVKALYVFNKDKHKYSKII